MLDKISVIVGVSGETVPENKTGEFGDKALLGTERFDNIGVPLVDTPDTENGCKV